MSEGSQADGLQCEHQARPSEDSRSTGSPEGHRLASAHNGDSKERQQQPREGEVTEAAAATGRTGHWWELEVGVRVGDTLVMGETGPLP